MTFTLLTVLLAASDVPTVQIPLERYEQLLHGTAPKPARSLTVVESLRVSGSLARGLTLTLTGRSMGDRPDVTVFPGDVSLQSCNSEQALLTIGESGGVVLTPLAARFTVKCGIAAPKEGPLTLAVLRVVDLGGAVQDAEVRVREVKDGVATLEVARPEPRQPQAITAEEAVLPPSVVGRYRLSVLPDDVRFRWELEAHNPNRHPVSFVVPVRANEALERLETTAKYEPTPEGFSVTLPPGDTALAVNGTAKGTRFEPPLEAAAQYVLVDSHPLLRLDLTTEGKRLSAAETGLKAEFRGAQGFLLARGQVVEWKATVLETLPASSYSVRSLASTFFVAPDGTLLGESNVQLDNAGAAELTLPMKARPEAAAIGGVSVPLTSTRQGDLRLPLGRGEQEITVRHRGALDRGFGFAVGRLELPGLGSEASVSSVELRTSSDWVPLYQAFAGRRWFALPALGDVVLALFFGVWAAQLLSSLGLSRRRATVLGAVTAVLASSTEVAHWPVVVGLSAGTMLWVLVWLRESKLKLVMPSGMAGYLAAMGVGVVVMVGSITVFGDNIRRLFGMSADALAGDASIGVRNKTLKSFGGASNYGQASSEASNSQGATYAGVGAVRELPAGRRRVALSEELVDTRAPTAASVVLVSATLLQAGESLLNLLALAMAFSMRRQLLAGLKVLLVRLLGARSPEPQPA